MIFYVNSFGCLVVAWLLAFAVMLDRQHIRRAWKPVMVLFIIEQGVLAYGSLEAMGSNVKVEARQVLFCIILASLALALSLVVAILFRQYGFLYGRGVSDHPPKSVPGGGGQVQPMRPVKAPLPTTSAPTDD